MKSWPHINTKRPSLLHFPKLQYISWFIQCLHLLIWVAYLCNSTYSFSDSHIFVNFPSLHSLPFGEGKILLQFFQASVFSQIWILKKVVYCALLPTEKSRGKCYSLAITHQIGLSGPTSNLFHCIHSCPIHELSKNDLVQKIFFKWAFIHNVSSLHHAS